MCVCVCVWVGGRRYFDSEELAAWVAGADARCAQSCLARARAAAVPTTSGAHDRGDRLSPWFRAIHDRALRGWWRAALAGALEAAPLDAPIARYGDCTA